ncbi:permease [Bifidobacterium aemilianum]|uniref:Probable membrane transporter protein n=1 Tax=Bifidobacterium aemilianum TaxID=2493120 RepID=A0A366K6A2_9BIFI|nr:sulfite exporter TauE/SafE family protein [Bifidobacterium aemilianum]RBP97199.1 permease [Bifidobacterium aemilianum]
MDDSQQVTAAAEQAGRPQQSAALRWALMALVGLLAGFLSGLFGIGGGSIIVPALVWAGLSQRQAAATSLAAIVPASVSGLVSYAMSGRVDWLAAILMACGSIVGSQLGAWLLSRMSELFLRWAWAAFLACVVVSQFVFIPSRDSSIHMTWLTGLCLLAIGLLIGTLSGLLGVGGGAVAVPALSLLFDASDLIARGTSLLAMFPGAITGTIANAKRGLVHLTTGLVVGLLAALAAPLGSICANHLSARLGSILLALYLAAILLRCIWSALSITPGLAASLGGLHRR